MKAFRSTITLIMATALILTTSCAHLDTETPSESGAPPAEKTLDFNFIFQYGIMFGNKLDTIEGTFTKDMIPDQDITIDLRLTLEEMDQILNKMEEIDFFNYPDVFRIEVPAGRSMGMVTPYESYSFEVTYGSIKKELLWNDEIIYQDEKADQLRELINLIRSIVESKEEYKNLPEPRGGYM